MWNWHEDCSPSSSGPPSRQRHGYPTATRRESPPILPPLQRDGVGLRHGGTRPDQGTRPSEDRPSVQASALQSKFADVILAMTCLRGMNDQEIKDILSIKNIQRKSVLEIVDLVKAKEQGRDGVVPVARHAVQLVAGAAVSYGQQWARTPRAFPRPPSPPLQQHSGTRSRPSAPVRNEPRWCGCGEQFFTFSVGASGKNELKTL